MSISTQDQNRETAAAPQGAAPGAGDEAMAEIKEGLRAVVQAIESTGKKLEKAGMTGLADAVHAIGEKVETLAD